MIHAKTEEEFQSLVAQLYAVIHPVKYSVLRTKKELKKTGMKYFEESF